MYRANLIARNLHASSENRRKQERLFEKERKANYIYNIYLLYGFLCSEYMGGNS